MDGSDCCIHSLPTLSFFPNLFSLPSRFRNLSQIHQRNYRNLNSLSSNHNFAAILPGDSVAGVVVANGILNFLNIYNTLLVVRLVLTWFPNSPPAIVSPLSRIVTRRSQSRLEEPYRGLVGVRRGQSSLVVVVVVDIFVIVRVGVGDTDCEACIFPHHAPSRLSQRRAPFCAYLMSPRLPSGKALQRAAPRLAPWCAPFCAIDNTPHWF
ncbi:YGGT family protein [Actinidia rufa]|uniref:YGGT family protein n=1 Tax=Actinidia rufa TaxID=165716 RepID=A0A7J0GXM5_9ERIC|nr:YGGT family protein [Actinidia rufa]